MAKSGASGGSWGKGKTDPASWFQKGCKPGPGRPKGSKNKKNVYAALSAEKVTVTKNGMKVATTKGELKYAQLINKAANGDLKAITKAIELDDKFGLHQPEAAEDVDFSADLASLDYLIALKQQLGDGKDPSND